MDKEAERSRSSLQAQQFEPLRPMNETLHLPRYPRIGYRNLGPTSRSQLSE